MHACVSVEEVAFFEVSREVRKKIQMFTGLLQLGVLMSEKHSSRLQMALWCY